MVEISREAYATLYGPTSGDQVEFSSPYPADLQHALDVVRRS